MEQNIAFGGAQNDDNLARTESLDTISEFSDGDTDESGVVPDDAPQEEGDSEDEASKDDDNGEEEDPEEEDDSKDEAPEDDDDAIKRHPLFIDQGVTKQGKIVNIKSGDPCEVKRYLNERSFVKLKHKIMGKVMVLRDTFIWECWNAELPSGMYVKHKNGREDDDRLSNLVLGKNWSRGG